jgi:hypothetical protein
VIKAMNQSMQQTGRMNLRDRDREMILGALPNKLMLREGGWEHGKAAEPI